MLIFEIVGMAWRGFGANKVRSALATSGITIGIFSVISVMTTISALQSSIETGLTFLGSNIFQFSKWPAGTFNTFGNDRFKNRRNIDYATYLEFARLMKDVVDLTVPKVFDINVQAVHENRKTNPNLTLAGTNQGFITSNDFKIADGRNLAADDVEFSRSVCVIGDEVVKRLFAEGGAVGRTIRLDNRTYEVIGTFAPKGGSFGGSDDDMVIIPITKFFENYGWHNRPIKIAVQSRNQLVYERTMGFATGAFRKARGLNPEDSNDFETYGNDSLASAFRNIEGVVRVGAFMISTMT